MGRIQSLIYPSLFATRFMKFYRTVIEWIKNQTFLLLFAIPLALGVLFAYQTANRYPVFVRAILGISVILLFGLAFRPSKKDLAESSQIQFDISKDKRFFIYNFLSATIIFWALVQIFNMIWYLINLF